jgi:hypothetical protein
MPENTAVANAAVGVVQNEIPQTIVMPVTPPVMAEPAKVEREQTIAGTGFSTDYARSAATSEMMNNLAKALANSIALQSDFGSLMFAEET